MAVCLVSPALPARIFLLQAIRHLPFFRKKARENYGDPDLLLYSTLFKKDKKRGSMFSQLISLVWSKSKYVLCLLASLLKTYE